MKRLVVLLLLGVGLWSGPAWGQVQQAQTALEALRPEARAIVSASDTTLHFETRLVRGGRIDAEEGVLRAAYRIATRVAPTAMPEAAARAYLRAAAPSFGWTAEAPDLAPVAVVEGRYSTHLVYQQTLRGVPVFGRQVKISLDRDNQPTMAVSGYAPHVAYLRDFDTRPALSAAEAAARAEGLVSAVGATTTAPELVVYPSKPARLAWHLVAWPDDAGAEWSVVIDAQTGALLHLVDQRTHAPGKAERATTVAAPRRARAERPASPPAVRRVQGSGLVFDPDPLTSAGVEYGGAYVDAGDSDVEVLNAQRVEVVLNDITQGSDGLYRLEGPFVAVDGTVGRTSYAPPAEADPHAFRYTRSNDHFEAVMVYYHLDLSQRYIQSLDVGRPIQQAPIAVNPHGYGDDDNSHYLPRDNALGFGDGGIDDAEDADVIWHEYGHALLHESAPGLLNSTEGKALHEGWSDYWAASYSRGLVDTGKVPDHDWRKVYTWDGNFGLWNGRRVDRSGTYPENLTRDIYLDGLLWATTMMEIYDVTGRAVIDRLSLASHGYLINASTFADAAAALVQADIDLHGGAHAGVLVDILGARGYVDPASYGPVVAHEPVPYAEQVGGPVDFEVDATAVTAPIDRVTVYYSINGGAFSSLDLAEAAGSRYAGTLTLPVEATEVRYYVEARDTAGLPTTLPAGAPQETFRFEVGPDTEAPVIMHEAPAAAALQAWPIGLAAEVFDNQGVDSVWVTYTIEAPDGSAQADGAFGLKPEDDQYIGTFDAPADVLSEGSIVRYRIHARDVATAANEAVSDEFLFEIVIQGVLASYNFETAQGVQGTGLWERGTPTFGVQVAHSGERVWATNLSGPYADAEQRSRLDLPPINLAGAGAAYLVFWHWYDFEHSGTVLPDVPTNNSFWDGGNVKVSTNGGSFVVAEPVGGYHGRIEDGSGNPLGGERGFGGYSYGWRRVVVPLPAENDVRVRFDFGSDASNEAASISYAGWALDDVRITTDLPTDAVPPTLLSTPPAVTHVDAGQLPPPFVVEATDDVGVASAIVIYEIELAAGGREAGELRLAMDPTDLDVFRGSLIPRQGLGVGDRITYRLSVTDFDGNDVAFPSLDQPEARIEFRLAEALGVLAGVQSTGLWRRTGSVWNAAATGPEAPPTSNLVLQPLDLPSNVETLALRLVHRYALGEGLGGNVELSDDGGETWNVIAPDGGYTASFAAGSHPMAGEPVFGGSQEALTETTFDLQAYAGQQVRLRIDFGAARAPAAGEFWQIAEATVGYSTLDDAFDVPRTLALHANFPDPFTESTTLSYTLPESMPVRMELFNILGQRITVLVDGTQEAGTHTVTLRRGGLAGGVYLVRMIAGGTQHVERMIITR